MGKIRYDRCKELIEATFKKGDSVGFKAFECLISKHIGSTDYTVSSTLQTMIKTGLIQDIGQCHFRIL